MILEREELRRQVATRQRQIEEELVLLRRDGSSAAGERIIVLEAKLDEARAVVQNSWERVTEAGASTLNQWLKTN